MCIRDSANHGWLDAKHHFSFGGYHDPARTSWGNLRVWNDDTIEPQTGFPPHPHRDMEIITYVREGAITHQDSLGNKGRTEAGEMCIRDRSFSVSLSAFRPGAFIEDTGRARTIQMLGAEAMLKY